MNNEVKTKFDNRIKISGVITKKDKFVNYVGFPIFGFEIQIPKTLTDEEILDPEPETHNSYRAVIFDNETFIDEVEIGEHILIDGEIQSRNFSQKHNLVEDDVQNAVDLYMNLFDEVPTDKKPTQYMNQPISWNKLFELNLLERVPSDSAIDEEQKDMATEQAPYYYKVDRNGEVTKESIDTIYEIIVHSYEILDVDDDFIDINEVTFHGRIAVDPIFDIDGFTTKTDFTAQAYLRYFQNEKRYAFLPFTSEGDIAERIFNDFKRNDFVTIKGALYSKKTDKVIRLKKVTPSGKTKRKRIVVDDLKRFIKVSEIEKQ